MKRIKYLEYLPIILIAFFAYRLINEKLLFSNTLSSILKMCSSFFWALAIGYVVNIIMSKFENRFNLSRNLSLSLAYSLLFAVLLLFFVVVVPSVLSTIPDLISDSTANAKNINEWYESTFSSKLTELSANFGIDINAMITSKMQDILKFITDLLSTILTGLGSFAISITTVLIDFFIGLVLSVYVLADKENFFAKTKKLFTAYCGEKFTKKAINIIHDTDEIFGNYLVAKSLDSFIVAVIAYVGFKLLGLQYSFLFSIVIGVTNMIPYFGPFIGAVPVVIITLFISPMKALWAGVFILILQQVDGNIIGPKIVDGKVGLPALWGVVSVTIGGTLFGFLGMLLGTPVFAVFRKIVLDVQDRKLKERELIEVFSKDGTAILSSREDENDQPLSSRMEKSEVEKTEEL